MKNIIFVILCIFASFQAAEARLKIVATTSDVAALVSVVVGDRADVVSIAKGSQDPHYIEAKPSYMVVLRDADLVVANGLSLEVGWLTSLLRGARNPRIQMGAPGFFDLGDKANPIEIPQGAITRALGDVHPDGNPHFTLDPIRVAELSGEVASRLATLDQSNKDYFFKNSQVFQASMKKKTEAWQARIKKAKVTKLVTYHPSLNYFLKRFQLESPIYVENKPGIPPTGQHILKVIQQMKDLKIDLILVDNFFDTKIADRIAKEVPGAVVKSVGVAVGSLPELKTLEDVTEQLVRVIESRGQ